MLLLRSGQKIWNFNLYKQKVYFTLILPQNVQITSVNKPNKCNISLNIPCYRLQTHWHIQSSLYSQFYGLFRKSGPNAKNMYITVDHRFIKVMVLMVMSCLDMFLYFLLSSDFSKTGQGFRLWTIPDHLHLPACSLSTNLLLIFLSPIFLFFFSF